MPFVPWLLLAVVRFAWKRRKVPPFDRLFGWIDARRF